MMRLEISRRADLALGALRALGGSGYRMKGPRLAECLQTTAGFIPQVVGPLVKAGWVRSEPGPTGGYYLAVPLESVSALEVIEAVEGPTDSGACVVVDGPCDAENPCVLHEAWARARAELMRSLASVPVSQLPLCGEA